MNQASLDCAEQITSDLWAVKGILADEELTHLLTAIDNEKDWIKIQEQATLNRDQIAWRTDGICDWLWCRLNELDFSRFDLKLRTVMIWRDLAGYQINNHADNDQVHAAMQIYLSNNCQNLGTWFENSIQIPFVQNTGYIMHNRNKMQHGMRHAVPDKQVRLSFYALFDGL